VTGEDFAALFDTFQHTAFRLECLQTYDVSAETQAVRAFREGLPRPERSVRTSPWLRRVAVTTAQGKRWSRVRVVAYPLTEYTRYELIGYVESQAAGEHIQLVDYDQVGELGPDFWLFDAGTATAQAVLMRYTADGQIQGFDRTTDPAELERLQRIQCTAEAHAVPLNEFLARTA
jgi:hypothetical protein